LAQDWWGSKDRVMFACFDCRTSCLKAKGNDVNDDSNELRQHTKSEFDESAEVFDQTPSTADPSPISLGNDRSTRSLGSRVNPAGHVEGPLTPLNSLPAEVSKTLLEADTRRVDGFPFEAEALIYALLERLRAEGPKGQECAERIKDTRVYRDLVEEMESVNALLSALLDDEGWTVQKAHDRIHVWTRPEKGSDLVTVRIAGVVEGPIDYFSSINKEVDLVKTWMTGVKTSYIVKALGTFDQVGYYCWKFPFVAAREFLIEENCAFNDAEGYCLSRRGPPTPREGLQLPGVEKGVIRAAISNWCSFTTPVGKNKAGQSVIFTTSLMNIDLKIPLPTRLVNHLSVAMGYNSFQQLRQNTKKSQDPSSALYKSVADPANAPYYGRLRGLEKAREANPIGCSSEIMETGWVKDPALRRTIFKRSEGVLVPMV